MALTIEVKNAEGVKVGSVDLPSEIFDAQTNVPLIHQVVTAQLAAARQGTPPKTPKPREKIYLIYYTMNSKEGL